MDNIPDTIIEHIQSFIDLKDVCRLKQVCKKFKDNSIDIQREKLYQECSQQLGKLLNVSMAKLYEYFIECHNIGYYDCELYEIEMPNLVHVLSYNQLNICIDLQFMVMEEIIKAVKSIQHTTHQRQIKKLVTDLRADICSTVGSDINIMVKISNVWCFVISFVKQKHTKGCQILRKTLTYENIKSNPE